MSRDPSVRPTALAARTRLERARASCQELLEELGFPQDQIPRGLNPEEKGVLS